LLFEAAPADNHAPTHQEAKMYRLAKLSLLVGALFLAASDLSSVVAMNASPTLIGGNIFNTQG
jgi:hypothetical protein